MTEVKCENCERLLQRVSELEKPQILSTSSVPFRLQGDIKMYRYEEVRIEQCYWVEKRFDPRWSFVDELYFWTSIPTVELAKTFLSDIDPTKYKKVIITKTRPFIAYKAT